jgi:hypothetical protein
MRARNVFPFGLGKGHSAVGEVPEETQKCEDEGVVVELDRAPQNLEADNVPKCLCSVESV